jgi:hypothetical protein
MLLHSFEFREKATVRPRRLRSLLHVLHLKRGRLSVTMLSTTAIAKLAITMDIRKGATQRDEVA